MKTKLTKHITKMSTAIIIIIIIIIIHLFSAVPGGSTALFYKNC